MTSTQHIEDKCGKNFIADYGNDWEVTLQFPDEYWSRILDLRQNF